MRVRFVVLGLVVGGCSTPTGSYLEVDGAAAGIKLDRVEFHFGKMLGTEVPSSPDHPRSVAGAATVSGTTFKRTFEDSDVQMLPARDTSFTYYLAPNSQQATLGDYVAAIAYDGATAVGIAELQDFSIPSDAIYEYPMPLVPFSGEDAEVWGTAARRCMRWARARTPDSASVTTLAVLNASDHDCDGFDDKDDCDALDYCPEGTRQCSTQNACIDAASCQVGSCANVRGTDGPQICAATACLGPSACAGCAQDSDPESCLLTANWDHPEINFPVTTQERLCTNTPPYLITFVLPDGKSCQMPKIELPTGGTWPDGFSIRVAPDAGGQVCLFQLFQPPTGKLAGDHHILLSFDDTTSTTGRTTIIIGFNPHPGSCAMPPAPDLRGIDYGVCSN